MDTLPKSASATAPLAPLDASHALRLTPIPPTTCPSFPLTHPYVELVYAPRLGPSAVLVARYLGRVLAANDKPVTICPAALSLELGMRSRNEEPLGRNSRLRRAIDRLARERLVQWIDDQHLAVFTAAPAVSSRARDALPPAARHAHDRFVNVIDLRDGHAR